MNQPTGPISALSWNQLSLNVGRVECRCGWHSDFIRSQAEISGALDGARLSHPNHLWEPHPCEACGNITEVASIGCLATWQDGTLCARTPNGARRPTQNSTRCVACWGDSDVWLGNTWGWAHVDGLMDGCECSCHVGEIWMAGQAK